MRLVHTKYPISAKHPDDKTNIVHHGCFFRYENKLYMVEGHTWEDLAPLGVRISNGNPIITIQASGLHVDTRTVILKHRCYEITESGVFKHGHSIKIEEQELSSISLRFRVEFTSEDNQITLQQDHVYRNPIDFQNRITHYSTYTIFRPDRIIPGQVGRIPDILPNPTQEDNTLLDKLKNYCYQYQFRISDQSKAFQNQLWKDNPIRDEIDSIDGYTRFVLLSGGQVYQYDLET